MVAAGWSYIDSANGIVYIGSVIGPIMVVDLVGLIGTGGLLHRMKAVAPVSRIAMRTLEVTGGGEPPSATEIDTVQRIAHGAKGLR